MQIDLNDRLPSPSNLNNKVKPPKEQLKSINLPIRLALKGKTNKKL